MGQTGADDKTEGLVKAACCYFWILKQSAIFNLDDELELNLTLGAVGLACVNGRCVAVGGVPVGAIIAERALGGELRPDGSGVRFVGFVRTCLGVAAKVRGADWTDEGERRMRGLMRTVWREVTADQGERALGLLRECGLDGDVSATEAMIVALGCQHAGMLREAIRTNCGVELRGMGALPEESAFRLGHDEKSEKIDEVCAKCPFCEKELRLPATVARGQHVRCGSCGQKFTVRMK